MKSFTATFFLAVACTAMGAPQERHATSPWEKEIVYQIFERSFCDSNGDRIGDFNGIVQKLGYLKKLGVTAILVQPIFRSPMYHNYFADSFLKVDPSFGTNKGFFDMVRAAHRRNLKVILDMEPQYVASKHPWFVAAQKAPHSAAAKRVVIGKGVFGLPYVYSYTGLKVPNWIVNTGNPEVKRSMTRMFRYWAAPPSRPQDGVDGFRIDHMMDDLDNLHMDTDMYRSFWAPLESSVKAVKPHTFFAAEQADWSSLGEEQFEKGKVDSVYAIGLRSAFVKAFDTPKKDQKPYQPGDVQGALKATTNATPAGKTQLVVIEDHDVVRFASLVKSDPRLLRLGAVFQLTSKGTPSIYYGQELGMKGVQLHGKTDGNDIPVRLAMRWNRSLKSRGTATWYGKGPWAVPTNSADRDGISVEEQSRDPKSLLNFYRKLIRQRKGSPALSHGSQTVLETSDPDVVAYRRTAGKQSVIVVLNLASATKSVKVDGDLPDNGTLELAGHDYRIYFIGPKTAAEE